MICYWSLVWSSFILFYWVLPKLGQNLLWPYLSLLSLANIFLYFLISGESLQLLMSFLTMFWLGWDPFSHFSINSLLLLLFVVNMSYYCKDVLLWWKCSISMNIHKICLFPFALSRLINGIACCLLELLCVSFIPHAVEFWNRRLNTFFLIHHLLYLMNFTF